LSDDDREPASTAELASRAAGLRTWGVLRGDVDNFGIRLRRATTIEEHIQLSVLYKQFFAGEMEVVCAMPEYWRRVAVIYSGGDDFAVYGAWDALLGLAREIERLFRRFAAQTLKELPGAEGKTISMAIALAPAVDASLAAVFEEAGERLEAAKSADKDCIWVLGRTLEWKQFSEAADLKESLVRMTSDFGCSPQYLRDPVRHLSRNAIQNVAPPGSENRGRAALALPSTYTTDPRRVAAHGFLSRVSESPHRAYRRADRTQRRDRQVAARRPRGARMGEVVGGGVAPRNSPAGVIQGRKRMDEVESSVSETPAETPVAEKQPEPEPAPAPASETVSAASAAEQLTAALKKGGSSEDSATQAASKPQSQERPQRSDRPPRPDRGPDLAVALVAVANVGPGGPRRRTTWRPWWRRTPRSARRSSTRRS
jgi:hypothetical protein